jgi:Zn-dependent peptidase ImmA (M78 family)
MSFALDSADCGGRIVLRSKWREGRRFELARILGDRLMNSNRARLHPATRAFTYRQKAQRSFAAKFLSPFESTLGMLEGDYSLENQLDVAAHFEVSEMTIRAQLVDHKMLEREDLEPDLSTFGARC